MKTQLLFIAAALILSSVGSAQEWEYMTQDTGQTSMDFILPADDGGHFGLNNFGNHYTVLRYDANDAVVWSQSITCVDDLWISSFLEGPDGNIYVEGEQYQTCYFVSDTLVGHHHFIARYNGTTGAEDLHVMPTNHGISKMFLNEDDEFTLFTTFGGWGANYTIINNDTVWTIGGRDVMVMTMNTSFVVQDTLRFHGSGFTNVYEPSVASSGYDCIITSYNSAIHYQGDSLGQHATYTNAHIHIDSDLDVTSAEYIPVDPQGASITDYYFFDHATYFIMRQSSWGDVVFQNTTLAADNNNKLWLIKLDSDGDLESSKLISSTGNQYVFGDLIYAPNDTLYVLGSSNQNFSLDQGDFVTQQYKSNLFVFLADTNFNTVMYSTIDDTTNGSSSINNPTLIDGDIYACGRFSDTVAINDEMFEFAGNRAWWGKLNLTGAVDTTTNDTTTNDTTNNDTTSSIGALTPKDIRIFPNPASNEVTVHSSNGTIEALEFYDMAGTKVKHVNVPQANIFNTNISDLPNGVYLINTVGDKSTRLKKLVVYR